MRILLTTYHQAFLTPAGGETELHQLAEFMSDCGARADIYGPNSRRLATYDAVVHFSTHGGGEGLLAEIKTAGKPIILIPNFNFFDQAHASKAIVQRHLDLADLVIIRTLAERDLCVQNFKIDRKRISIIPPGIAPAFAKPAEPGLFQAAYGLDRFILWVGQLARHKRQLEAIRALSGLEVPLIFIGGYAEKNYYDQCRSEAGSNVRFLPYVQPASEILRSAFQTCSAYLELGDDYPGFSALEAALAGRRLVLNDHPWTREMLGPGPIWIEPGNWDKLPACIDAAIGKTNSDAELIERVRGNFLQPKPTRALLSAISKLLVDRS